MKLFMLVCASLFLYSTADNDSSVGFRSPRIIGGVQTRPHEFPFLAYIRIIRQNQKHHCGGSIITKNYVLTAAHCVFKVTPIDVDVLAGAYQLSFITGTEQYGFVNKIVVHPQYNDDTQENDIALIQVAIPFKFNSFVSPIGLATEMDTSMADTFTVSGWGVTNANSISRSDFPRKVRVPIVPNEVCQEAYQPLKIFDSNFCAGYLHRGGADACRGDSGGPLFMNNPFVLIGIVSWGNSCALIDYPGVYTKVPSFIPWITSNVF